MNSESRNGRTSVQREGAVVMEVMMALLICAAVVVVIAQTVSMVARQREFALRRHLASEEAANVMEKVAALNWENLTQGNVDTIDLSDGIRSRLPSAELSVQIIDKDQEVARRISISIAWTGPSGTPGPAAELVAWRYPEREPKP